MTYKFEIINGETRQIDEKGFIVLTAKTDDGRDFFVPLFSILRKDVPIEQFDGWLMANFKMAMMSLKGTMERG